MLKLLFSPNFKMAKVDRVLASPSMALNTSLGLNCLNSSSTNSLNISEEMANILPKKSSSKHRYSFSPMPSRIEKSPNVSPIKSLNNQMGTPSSNFLKRRDLSSRLKERNDEVSRNPLLRVYLTPNVNLEKRLSVCTVLKDLGLSKLNSMFADEEIDLLVLFTLNDDDLQSIGVSDEQERRKILEFIKDFKTPDKTVKTECRFLKPPPRH